MLRALRFLGEPILGQCLAGTHRMMKPESGPAVYKIQTALVDLGFSLPQFGVDGHFGDETAAAVSAYKVGKHLSPSDGVVGSMTMQAFGSRSKGSGPDSIGVDQRGRSRSKGSGPDSIVALGSRSKGSGPDSIVALDPRCL